MERWKDAYGYPSYEISTNGVIRNKNTKKIKTTYLDNDGYEKASLYKKENGDKISNRVLVHRLMCETFLGGSHPNLQVNHINGVKDDNRIENLEWAIPKENVLHSYNKNKRRPSGGRGPIKRVYVVETGKIYENLHECAKDIGSDSGNISKCLHGVIPSVKGYHIIYAEERNDFLYPHQKEALNKMFNGCVLNGTVGSGKSRVGLYYYFRRYGGSMEPEYRMMRPKPKPADLYILTTAKKRNDMEWEEEMTPFLLSTDQKRNVCGNKVVIDSWQNIKKYSNVKNAFFIFDENKINGKGVWAKSFLTITKNNEWIILSASNGDRIEDYETLFIAEGFVKNRTEFREQFLVYSRYTNFPMVTGYRNERRFFRCRDKILIDMDFKRKTIPHHEDIFVEYDHKKYKDVVRTRWDIYKDEPIQQASGLCLVLRRVVNEDPSRENAILDILKDHPKAIIFYNFDTELEILLNISYQKGTEIAQYNGHKHEPIPKGNRWVYLVNYNACEAWNTIRTNCMIFYSQNYSYKVMLQASGRIDRLNTPYTDLYYYHLKSHSGIDLAISRALSQKKKFNERKFTKWD